MFLILFDFVFGSIRKVYYEKLVTLFRNLENLIDNYILGLSYYYHDSAAYLVKNREVIASALEERFSRKRHDSGFPKNAFINCLKKQGIIFQL